MHQALSLPDILISIFSHDLCQRDLLRVATVCRRWTDWALDARWRNCEVPFRELLKTLGPVPLVTLGLHGTAVRLEVQASPSHVTASQWELFINRSGLISRLRISGTALSPRSVALLKELRLRYGGTLFKFLRQVSLEFEPDGVDVRTANIAAVPSLQVVNLRTDCFSDAEVFVKGLPRQSPHINSIHVVSEDYGDDIVGLPLQMALRIFSYRAPLISRVAWKAIKQCTWLVKLSLSEEGPDNLGLDEIEVGWGKELVDLPNLQQLDLDLLEASAIALVVLLARMPALKALHFGPSWKAATANQVFRVQEHLATHCPSILSRRAFTSHP